MGTCQPREALFGGAAPRVAGRRGCSIVGVAVEIRCLPWQQLPRLIVRAPRDRIVARGRFVASMLGLVGASYGRLGFLSELPRAERKISAYRGLAAGVLRLVRVTHGRLGVHAALPGPQRKLTVNRGLAGSVLVGVRRLSGND